MKLLWSEDGNRHILTTPHPTDPNIVFPIAFMELMSFGEYGDVYEYIITGRLYNCSENDDYFELGAYDSLEGAKAALEKEIQRLFTEEFEYWNNIMGVTQGA